MNKIQKSPVDTLGYNFIPQNFLPKGKNEYHLRDRQISSGIKYRQLTAYEMEVLVRNRNTSDNWNNILVSNAFNPELVQDCKFYGLVRISKLEPFYLEFNNLRRPVGFYNSTIISCDFGDNVVIDNVNYISHYIVGNEVIIVNVNELATTDYAKFGNGIVKEGEQENIRIWLEVCNENGGRKIVPFNGMLPGDAWLWTRFRDRTAFQEQLLQFTQKKFDAARGFYGYIGDRTVIKNCRIFKDVNIGTDAYIKGANKLKNLTINSSADAKSQVGEGCELVNGIIDYGCRVFYGVKAVRFFLASHSQLKYGARLINSYLGNNSTISCCEVLNSLIFPSHEQHHNNSFLCASLLQGQTNMAAGATIGSNHNSRSADGEMVAGRGFWPGLCVSLKHNSRFASYAMLAKGDYPSELDIPLPFALISQDVSKNVLQVMPGYWFLYNMYALARNSWKYVDRDKRTIKKQQIEFDFLAPDTINELLQAIKLFCSLTGDAFHRKQNGQEGVQKNSELVGQKLLESKDAVLNELEILAPSFENSRRKVIITKTITAYHLFKDLIDYYVCLELMKITAAERLKAPHELKKELPAGNEVIQWKNMGGQLVPEKEVEQLVSKIEMKKLKSWDDVHAFYKKQADQYAVSKLNHAVAVWNTMHGRELKKISDSDLQLLLEKSIATREWMVKSIHESRSKDYKNPYRKMIYSSDAEMDAVVGKFNDNEFIRYEEKQFENYKKTVESFLKQWNNTRQPHKLNQPQRPTPIKKSGKRKIQKSKR
ncbi:MAG TPA: DUF4954 family protein [Flavitalea sp.]|nr:DUF4954 family protein [Flavitalea sp.]